MLQYSEVPRAASTTHGDCCAHSLYRAFAEKVIDRGEKIELLVDKAEELNEQAARFKKQSNTVRRPPRAHTHTRAHARTRTVPSATAVQR